jgi:secreted trypsin-like serine protease
MSRSMTNGDLKKIVKRAISRAEKHAPRGDHRAFLDTLRAHATVEIHRKAGGAAARSAARSGPKQPKGPRLADDPRYLANVRTLARRTAQNARIIGGSAVKGAGFNDCVAVGDDDFFGCTGTLIAPNVVLTAGHCESLHTRVFVGNDTTKKGRVFKIARHVRHPRFDGDFNNDLMLLILEKKVTGVKPRAIASSAVIDAAIDGKVVGFGTTDLAGTVGDGIKRQTDVPVVSPSCRGKVNGKSDGTVYGCHVGREIVAGKPLLLHDTCKGDSGGPFFVANSKGQWLLAGVTSRGTDLGTTICGDGGLYVRVDQYRAWIASVIGG